MLETYHPNGFAVRLHNLGDFYSVEYVELWRRLLARHSALHVWGYTARWHSDDPIAAALASLVEREWDRFAVRFSNAPSETCSTISVEHPYRCSSGCDSLPRTSRQDRKLFDVRVVLADRAASCVLATLTPVSERLSLGQIVVLTLA